MGNFIQYFFTEYRILNVLIFSSYTIKKDKQNHTTKTFTLEEVITYLRNFILSFNPAILSEKWNFLICQVCIKRFRIIKRKYLQLKMIY